MAYKISDDCIACGTCAGVCPVSAISEGDGKYVIDADALVVGIRTAIHPIDHHAAFSARFPLFPRVDFPGKAEQSNKEAGTVRARLAFSLFRRFRPLHPRGA